VQPNPAHRALVDLERRWRGPVLVVTQNIDDLHERAGQTNLIHMHGELFQSICIHCRSRADCRDDLSVEHACEIFGRRSGMRPDVVWFGEKPYHMGQIDRAIENAKLFVSIGTSGNVYPAANFVSAAIKSGAVTVELNLERSAGSDQFDVVVQGRAGTVVPAFVSDLLKERLRAQP
jgi:NAD-dependent deacetylase